MPTLAQRCCQQSSLLTREPMLRSYSACMQAFHAFFQRLEPFFQPLAWLTCPKARLMGMSSLVAKPYSCRNLLGGILGAMATRISAVHPVIYPLDFLDDYI